MRWCTASTLSRTTCCSRSTSASSSVPDSAHPGVVADAGDEPYGPASSALDERAAGVRVGEVAHLDVRVDAVPEPQLLGELAQPLLAAGDEDDVMAALGELPCELRADARGGPGDHDGLPGRRRR